MNPATTPRGAGPTPGGSLPSDPPGSPASRELLGQWQAFVAEWRPLAESALRLAKAQGELLCGIAEERARLTFGRVFAWCSALVFFAIAWACFSVFIWQGSTFITGHAWTGPLVLGLLHLLAGFAMLNWRKGLHL